MTSEDFSKRVADSKVTGEVQLTATEIRHNLHDAMKFLEDGGKAVVVTKHGKEVFRMVPPVAAPPTPDNVIVLPLPAKAENVDANGSPVVMTTGVTTPEGVVLPLAA